MYKGDTESDTVCNDGNLEFMDEEIDDIKEYNKGSSNDDLRAEVEDRYIGTHVHLKHNNNIIEGIVSSRKQNPDGKELIGVPNDNPLLNTRIYSVTFPDGSNEEYTANTIA